MFPRILRQAGWRCGSACAVPNPQIGVGIVTLSRRIHVERRKGKKLGSAHGIHRFVFLKFLIEKKPAYLDFDIPIFVYPAGDITSEFCLGCGWIRAGRHPFVVSSQAKAHLPISMILAGNPRFSLLSLSLNGIHILFSIIKRSYVSFYSICFK
jgi:hypothetical protein